VLKKVYVDLNNTYFCSYITQTKIVWNFSFRSQGIYTTCIIFHRNNLL